TILCEIAAANTLRVFLQVLKDAVHIPTAANIVSHDGVKHVRSIFARRRTFARDLLNDLDWVFAPAAVEAVTLARCGLFCSCSFASLAPTRAQSNNLLKLLRSRLSGSNV